MVIQRMFFFLAPMFRSNLAYLLMDDDSPVSPPRVSKLVFEENPPRAGPESQVFTSRSGVGVRIG